MYFPVLYKSRRPAICVLPICKIFLLQDTMAGTSAGWLLVDVQRSGSTPSTGSLPLLVYCPCVPSPSLPLSFTRTTIKPSMISPFSNTSIGVGFGTAALGGRCYDVTLMALQEGFRRFDTAEEHEYWYDPASVGRALKEYFQPDVCKEDQQQCDVTCQAADLRVSTKIPPWSLTSEADIRASAANSRQQLVGFCTDETSPDWSHRPFPLDVYYIHAPECWHGWHPRCDDPPDLQDLRSAWLAMEAVVGLDYSARRIGLSNVSPSQLLDIIHFVQEREQQQQDAGTAPPRRPDVVQSFADPIEPSDALRNVCQQHGIEFVSYSTLGTQHRSVRENPVLASPIVTGIARKHGRSTAEVVLSWALHKGMSVIPRSSRREHIRELARLFADPTFLDAEDIHAIDLMKHTV